MPAVPLIGMKYRQEFLEGEAEYFAEIVSISETLTVPVGSYTNVLKTREWNPYEKNSDEYKYWAKKIGFLRAESLSTSEYEELISHTN